MANRPKIVTFPGWDDLDKRFEPYAVQLGWIAYSWNALHDALGSLFWALTGSQNGNVPLAIWNSIPNDRTQRGVLRAVAQTVLAGKETELRAVLWLLAAADKFEDKRNDALHTPFTFQIDPNDTRLVSKSYSGHKRALKLKDKELLPEFDGMAALFTYLRGMRCPFALRSVSPPILLGRPSQRCPN